MKFEKKIITPELAKQYLDLNTNNRIVRRPVLLAYKNDMEEGRWKEDTAEFIKISKSGRILDGQHRLMAIVLSKKSIPMHIATGMDEGVFDVLDTGSRRNSSDIFHISDIKNSNMLPSLIQLHGILSDGFEGNIRKNKQHKKTNAELLSAYYSNVVFWEAVSTKTINWYRAISHLLTPQFIGGLYAHFYELSQNDAESFMNQLCTGIDIKNNIIILLRNKLIQDKLSIKKMPSTYKVALVIKAWNIYRKGASVLILKFNPEVEKFPIAI